MASPFRIFRRHQKALLIVAGVVLMLVFVLADSLQMLISSSSGSSEGPRANANAVAVRWNGGKLTNAELDELVVRRRVVNSFLRAVEQEGYYAEQVQAASRGTMPRQSRIVELITGPETQGVERDLVRVRVFAEAAEAAGMQVSDELIRQYLYEVGFRHVTSGRMVEMIGSIQVGRGGAPTAFVFEGLREELLAHLYRRSHAYAASTLLPEQRWRDWLRVNDRVTIEAAAYPAENFLIDVAEPAEAELTEYYEKYKIREPLPDLRFTPELPSPDPGFRVPRKIDVQFVRADFNKLLEKIKGEITEEDIQKYYNENKDPYFIKAGTELIDKPKAEADAGQGDAKQVPGATTPAGETDASKAGTTTTPAAGGAAKEPQATPDAGKSQPPAPGGAVPSTAPRGDGKSAGMTGESAFRFASFTQQSGGEAEKRSDAKTSESQLPPTTNPATPPTLVPPAAPAGQAGTEGATAQPGAAAGDATAAQGMAGEQPKKPLEFQPLDEVREEIRRQLATPKVHSRLDALVTQLEGELNTEFNKYFTALVDAQAAKQTLPTPPPVLADMSSLAEKHELEYRRTGPMSALQLRDDEVIGKLLDMNRLMSAQQQIPIISTLFHKDTDLYKPIVTADIDNNRFIMMKIEDTPGRVPPLSEIRDEVVRHWKLDKAAEAAKKRADEVAKKVQDAGSPLADYFADDASVKVIRTDSFSEITAGDVPLLAGGQYRFSAPEGIVAAGPEFLRGVFNLEEGEATALFNHDQSIVYVVRIAAHEHQQDKLREMYLAEASTWPGLRMMESSHARDAEMVLIDSIWTSAGVEEVRPLDPPEVEEETNS
jgi:hypothetical protein